MASIEFIEEIALRQDQADIAANYLKQTATYLMAITIKEALKKNYTDPKNHKVLFLIFLSLAY